nr:hypothetical protein [Solirubrobacterales bacterium]
VPDPLLEDVDGSLITTSPGLEDCTEGFAASADADGTGSVAIRVDGEADPERLTLQEQAGISFGDPDADGDLLTVPVSSTDASPAAVRALQLLLVGYECP